MFQFYYLLYLCLAINLSRMSSGSAKETSSATESNGGHCVKRIASLISFEIRTCNYKQMTAQHFVLIVHAAVV